MEQSNVPAAVVFFATVFVYVALSVGCGSAPETSQTDEGWRVEGPGPQVIPADEVDWAPDGVAVRLHTREMSERTEPIWRADFDAFRKKPGKITDAWADFVYIFHEGWREVPEVLEEHPYPRVYKARRYPHYFESIPEMYVGLGGPFTEEYLDLYQCTPPRSGAEGTRDAQESRNEWSSKQAQNVYYREDYLVICGHAGLTVLFYEPQSPPPPERTYRSFDPESDKIDGPIPERFREWRNSLMYVRSAVWKDRPTGERKIEGIDVYRYFPDYDLADTRHLVFVYDGGLLKDQPYPVASGTRDRKRGGP